MASFRQTIRDRKKGFREIKRALKDIDTIIEKVQRFVDRKMALKRAPIEIDDLDRVVDLIKDLGKGINAIIKLIAKIREIFG